MTVQNPIPADQTHILNFEPLTIGQLLIVVDELFQHFKSYRPEFVQLFQLQRNAGTRVTELFQPVRWDVQNNRVVHVQPQKRNALRILNFADIGIADADEFQAVVTDMRRLPQRQYERAFASIVAAEGLWRCYDEGFMHPSTHLLRHVKIQQLAAEGWSTEAIATWIGEKNTNNIDYYLNSRFYL